MENWEINDFDLADGFSTSSGSSTGSGAKYHGQGGGAVSVANLNNYIHLHQHTANATSSPNALAERRAREQTGQITGKVTVQLPQAQEKDEFVRNALTSGIREIMIGKTSWGKLCLQRVLDIEPDNELALVWMAYLTENLDERIAKFSHVLTLYPANQTARSYLIDAERQQEEIEYLIEGSTLEDFWERNKRHQARLRKYIPYLGEYLVRQGLLTVEQLENSLAHHQARLEAGSKQRLGQLMIELGYVTKAQLEVVLADQKEEFNRFFKD